MKSPNNRTSPVQDVTVQLFRHTLSQGLGDLMKCILCIAGIYLSKFRNVSGNWICAFYSNRAKNELLEDSQETM